MKYILKIAYDGTCYYGWQAQEDHATVAGQIEKAFTYAFKTNGQLLGASRTDKGVHALGQIALLTTDLVIDPNRIVSTLNEHLPEDIHIRQAMIAPDDFHPLARVLQKTYYYHFFTSRPLPFVARYGTICRTPLDVECLQSGLQVFVGTHDFRSFCSGDHYDTTVRRIDSISLDYIAHLKMYRIRVRGPKFMHYMIRRIVGAALDTAGRPGRTIKVLEDALAAQDPRQQLPKAPAQGLVLRSIHYEGLCYE